jgi:hypothetical protein
VSTTRTRRFPGLHRPTPPARDPRPHELQDPHPPARLPTRSDVSPPLLASVRAPVLDIDGGGARFNGGTTRFSGGATRFGAAAGAGGAAPGRRRRPPWLRACGLEERGGGATEEEGDAGAVRTTISFPPF